LGFGSVSLPIAASVYQAGVSANQ